MEILRHRADVPLRIADVLPFMQRQRGKFFQHAERIHGRELFLRVAITGETPRGRAGSPRDGLIRTAKSRRESRTAISPKTNFVVGGRTKSESLRISPDKGTGMISLGTVSRSEGVIGGEVVATAGNGRVVRVGRNPVVTPASDDGIERGGTDEISESTPDGGVC